VVIYDTQTWKRLATIKFHDWFTYFALSAAGDQLYAVSPIGKRLTIYDTQTYGEVGGMNDLGGAPGRILVPHEH
jgi:hypothetical protein